MGMQWQIMLANGRVLGPYSTADVLKMLEQNMLTGDEKIKPSKGGQWIPFIEGPEFYDALMTLVLKAESKHHRPVIDVVAQETVIQKLPIEGSQKSNSADPSDQEVTNNKSLPVAQEPLPSNKIDIQNLPVTIELQDLAAAEQEALPKNSSKKMAGVFLSLAVLLLLFLAFYAENDGDSQPIRLLRPDYGPVMSSAPKELEAVVKRAVGFFERDSFDNYLETQSILVGVLGQMGNSLEARGFLCLTYRELWPFVMQDATDNETFLNLVKSTKAIDPVGEYGAYCEISRLLAHGRVNEARGVVDYHLAQPGSSGSPIFIGLKAEILGRGLEYENANLFLDTAQKLWPNWVKLAYLKGQFSMHNGNMEAAILNFNQALAINPRHRASMIQKGIIEYRFLKNSEAALQTLLGSLEIRARVLRALEVRSYYTLAQIYSDLRQMDDAKKYIERAYSLQPGDADIRALYTRLGGQSGPGAANFKQSELVYLGDQYYNLGDCLAAQAEYKAAFEIDPENAVAAMKAGRCLWQLSQPADATEWLRKAISSDPNLVEAVVLLADYLSQRFDFASALEVLNRSAQVNPNSAEVYKGYGIIEFRRNNLKGAISYLQRSLKIFDNDETALVLMARAHAGLDEYDQAQNYAIRALEIDPTNAEAMVVYGKNLAQHKGVSAGINYFSEQIKKFAYTQELRVALAEVYYDTERYQESERAYLQIVDFNPKSKIAWIGLGRSYQAQLKYREAARAFIEASILDVSDAEPVYYLGRLYLDMNQPGRALVHFEKAMKINPQFPNLYFHSGRAALMLNDLQQALAYALKERQKNPNIAESYLLAAEIYDINQEYQLCANEYQKAVKLRPQGALIHVKMARCYRLAGSVDIAESMLSIATGIESGLAEIYREQGAIFEARMDFRAAIAAYERYLMLSPNARDRGQVEQKILQLER